MAFGGEMKNIIEIYDSKIIVNILNRAFLTVAKEFNFTKENASNHPAFIDSDKVKVLLDKGLKMYGYKEDDQIIGCVGYSYFKNQKYFIERLATLPEYRHLGIGKKLMEFIENEIRKIGGKIIEIHVVDKNTVLREWYKKQKYIEIRIDKIETLPFNSCVMNKDLK
jgi:ribosomal protein S18 acetylase RimI-like enzyme